MNSEMKNINNNHPRQQEILADFHRVLDRHLLDVVEGRVDEMYEIRDIAKELFIHPNHLTDTIKQATGHHPCVFFQEKLMTIAKALLEQNEMPINAVALLLTYDPSNFTKFFKRFANQTPKQYRTAYLAQQRQTLPQHESKMLVAI